MPRRTFLFIGSATVALVVGYLGVARLNPAQSGGRVNSPTSAQHDYPTFASPCGGGESELARANSEAKYEILMPEHDRARAESLEAVWDCPGDAYLLRFESGITVFYDVSTIADPELGWAALAAENPEIYSVEKVRGVMASVTDPSGDKSGETNGGVTLVSDGLYISVGGNGSIPVKELIAVTESLK